MVDWGERGAADSGRLDDRVRTLLEENGGRLAFNGLRRALHVHPESLTRALRRLEREGVVRRSDDGYALAPGVGVTGAERETPVVHPIASVQLPSGLPADGVFGQLAGRWFGDLRWVGVYDRPDDPWLVWSVGDSGRHVMLSVGGGTLQVLVEGQDGKAAPPEVEAASWELLRQALERLRPEATTPRRDLATFDLGPAPDWRTRGVAG